MVRIFEYSFPQSRGIFRVLLAQLGFNITDYIQWFSKAKVQVRVRQTNLKCVTAYAYEEFLWLGIS